MEDRRRTHRVRRPKNPWTPPQSPTKSMRCDIASRVRLREYYHKAPRDFLLYILERRFHKHGAPGLSSNELVEILVAEASAYWQSRRVLRWAVLEMNAVLRTFMPNRRAGGGATAA